MPLHRSDNEDRDILLCAYEYLEDFLKGTAHEKIRKSNERVVPWNTARLCDMVEAVKPYDPLCDQTYFFAALLFTLPIPQTG